MAAVARIVVFSWDSCAVMVTWGEGTRLPEGSTMGFLSRQCIWTLSLTLRVT